MRQTESKQPLSGPSSSGSGADAPEWNKAAQGIIFAAATLALFVLVYLYRPPMETAVIRQARGTEITKPYMGRALLIENGKHLSQTFTAPSSGRLSGVGIFTPIPNDQAGGQMKFELFKLAKGRKALIASDSSNLSRWANNEGLSVFNVSPLTVRKGDRFLYRLTVGADPGFYVFHSPGDNYKGGSATIDKRRLGVDTAFQVFYKIDARGLWRLLDGPAPNLIGPAPLAGALVLLYFALTFFLWALWGLMRQETPWQRENAAQSPGCKADEA